MYDKVLIATDGSEASTGCVEYGLAVAEAMDADVDAMYVVETGATYILTVDLADSDLNEYRAYGEEVVTDVVEQAADRNLRANGVVKMGNPAEKIAEHADTNDFDLIVVGKQGHGAIDRHLGGTAESVMWLAETPVTVVGGD